MTGRRRKLQLEQLMICTLHKTLLIWWNGAWDGWGM